MNNFLNSIQSNLQLAQFIVLNKTHEKIQEDKCPIKKIGQSILLQSQYQDICFAFAAEPKSFSLLSCLDEDYLDNLLADQEKIQLLAQSLIDIEQDEKEDSIESDLNLKKNQENKWLNEWALTGGIPLAGAAIGTVQQLVGSKTGFSFLQGINLLKQIEIKKFAYGLPMAPLFIDLASKVYQDDSKDSFGKKVVKAAQSMNKKEVAFTLASCGLSLATAGAHSALLKVGVLAFDLSGHIMTKTVSSAILAKGLTQDSNEKSSKLKKVATYTYIATDTLMLHKTAMRFHTPEETIAGAIWGLINLGVAKVLTNKLMDSSDSKHLTSLPEKKDDDDYVPTVNFLTDQPIILIEDYMPKEKIEEKKPDIESQEVNIQDFIIKDYFKD